jgi:predicted O-methyltransferase YrrM
VTSANPASPPLAGLRARARTRTATRRLERLGRTAPEARAVAGAVLDALRDAPLAPGEREVVERIEARRRALVASQAELAVRRSEWTGDPDDDDVLHGTVGEFTARAAKSEFWALLLFRLVRRLDPRVCVELGTNMGISAAYQASALALAGGDGRLYSIEAAHAVAGIARETFAELGLAGRAECRTGRFDDVLEPLLAEVGPAGYAFVDGHHHEEPTLRYFEALLPHLTDPAVLVFDDVAHSDEMRRAWRRIAGDERVRLALDLGQIGICTVGGEAPRESVELTVARA